MVVRFCLEMKTRKRFPIGELRKKLEGYEIKIIDLGNHVYVAGTSNYTQFSEVMERCLPFAVIKCEAGMERPR